METLLVNLSGDIRRETLDSREYLVAPLTMIVPGVLNGSKGPLYYPLEEISRNALAWNNMPIVLDHPVDPTTNTPLSARNPAILNQRGVGYVFNASVTDKLRAEGWFDVNKLSLSAPDILNRLQSRQKIELSTGLNNDEEPVAEGTTFNGRSYKAIARNYRPDHLAILTKDTGACSINDGCGVNVNKSQVTKFLASEGSESPPASTANADEEKGGLNKLDLASQGLLAKFAEMVGLKVNVKATHSDIRSTLSNLLSQRFSGMDDGFRDSAYLIDVTDKVAIYERYDASTSTYRTFSIPYKADGKGNVSLGGEAPTEVQRVTQYKPVTNADSTDPVPAPTTNVIEKTKGGKFRLMSKDRKKVLGTFDTKAAAEKREKQINAIKNNAELYRQGKLPYSPTNGDSTMDKTEMIDSLVANCECWTEEDRGTLNDFSDEKIAQLHKSVQNSQTLKETAEAAKKGFESNGVEFTFNAEKKEWAGKPKVDSGQSQTNNSSDQPGNGKSQNQQTQNQGISDAPKSAEEWLKQAPPEIQEMVANNRRREEQHRTALIEQLTANIADEKQRDDMAKRFGSMSSENLEALAANFGKRQLDMFTGHATGASPAMSYFGAAGAPAAPTQNQQFEEDHLDLPEMQFSEAS